VVARGPRLSRRAFLGASGAVVAGVALGGCGSEEPTAREGDRAVLAAALAAERAAIADLTALVGGLRGEPRAALERALAHDRAHAARLRRALRDLGARAGGGPAGGGAPATGPAEALRAAGAVKLRLYSDHLDRLPDARTPAVRRMLASIAAVDAAHVAALRAAGGADPVDEPFVMGGSA
jgi:TAT (twin-arginine translocation) pathway signal sequence